MKDNILSINLATSTAPVVQEVRGKDYIEYGTDDWKNLYPQFLIDLYYNSSTHAAIINGTSEMIAGEDLVVDENEENLDAYVKLKKFFRHANSKESLHQIIKKVSFDFKLQGAYALHVIWNRERTEIAELYHVPVERIRAGRPNEMGKVDTYFISSDWSNTRMHKPYPVAAFNVNDRTAGSQILYTGAYSPNMDVYHTPDYIASNNWALVDQRVAEFHLNNISNGFAGSYFISFANGVPTQEERIQIERSLKDKFTGAQNSGSFVLTFSDDKTRTPEITPIQQSDADKTYLALQELLVQNILTGHRVTSPMLLGIKSDTGLGSNADELNAAANFYLNTVVRPFQLHILGTLQTIFSVNNIDLPVSFVQMKPITIKFTNQDLAAVMTQDEIREELGLAPLNEEVIVKDELSSNKTELDIFLETIEDIPEGWELIHEEEVDGEHLDFDYEAELNKIADGKTELTSTGRANPNARSSQDGLNKSKTAFYKVRYVYANDNFLENKSGTHREFCTKMMDAKKIYRKEDIARMSKKSVNPGFGIDGANNYDIFLWKGGPQCFHFWLRQVYKAPKSDDNSVYYPDNIQDDENIGFTQARKEGFTAEKNDNLVAIPPRKMKNNGYYN
tara:strand:+ start:1658 stop:3514 length:1857 start_codon:yes stop_codon:yes gene_type:complete